MPRLLASGKAVSRKSLERCWVLPSMQDPHPLLPTMAHLGLMLDTHALEQSDWGDEREVWETPPPPERDTIVG